MYPSRTYQIVDLNKLCPDLLSVVLVPVGEALRYKAGQYVEILCPDGSWLPFSLSNRPEVEGNKELIIRLSTEVASFKLLLSQCVVGTLLHVRGPFGGYEFPTDKPLLMLAGGTGIAPIKSLIEDLSLTGEIHLFWGVRHSSELFLSEQISNWIDQGVITSFTPVVSREPENTWSGAKGWVHESVISQHPDLSKYDIYASGPMPMIKGAVELYPQYGLDIARFYSDMLPYLQFEQL